jgi:hypothetical protein
VNKLEILAAVCLAILALWSLLSWVRRHQVVINAKHYIGNPGLTRVEAEHARKFPYDI